MSEDNKPADLARLKEVLSAYGGNSEKWPVDERAGLEELLKRQPELTATLKREFDEAHKLDQLLSERAVTADQDVTELGARIMAEIANEKSRATSNRVTELKDYSRKDYLHKDDQIYKELEKIQANNNPGRPNIWQTAALLAATLILGIYIGATYLAAPSAESVAALTGADNPATVEYSLFQNEPVELFGEEL